MIFPNHYQTLAPICMQMIAVFDVRTINMRTLKNILNKEILSLRQWFIDIKLSIHFGEYKTKSVLFSKRFKGN